MSDLLKNVDFIAYFNAKYLGKTNVVSLLSTKPFQEVLELYNYHRLGRASAGSRLLHAIDDEQIREAGLLSKVYGADPRLLQMLQIASYRQRIPRSDPRYLPRNPEIGTTELQTMDSAIQWYSPNDDRRFDEIEQSDVKVYALYWMHIYADRLKTLLKQTNLSVLLEAVHTCGVEGVPDIVAKARDLIPEAMLPIYGYDLVNEYVLIEISNLMCSGLLYAR